MAVGNVASVEVPNFEIFQPCVKFYFCNRGSITRQADVRHGKIHEEGEGRREDGSDGGVARLVGGEDESKSTGVAE